MDKPQGPQSFQEETRARSRQARIIRAILATGAMVRSDWIDEALLEPVNDAACEPTHKFIRKGVEHRFGLNRVRMDLHGGQPHDRCDCGRMLAHPVHEVAS